MKYLKALIASMTGHVFFVLLGGMAVAGLIAGIASNINYNRNLQHQVDERTADRLQSFISFLETAPPEFRARLLRRNGSGVLGVSSDLPAGEPDLPFSKLLWQRGGVLGTAKAEKVAATACIPARGGPPGPGPFRPREFPRFDRGPDVGGMRADSSQHGEAPIPPECRAVSLTLGDGTVLRLGVESAWLQAVPNRLFDPAFVSLFGAGIVLLAYVTALRAGAPLRRLAQASTLLGNDLHRQPLALTGPSEVRQAIAAFNSMQARLQRHFAERTQMLAAITHDLQTPLTRLRLRLERVEDVDLRERLIADMQAMRALIDEGLELARTAETPEAAVMLDLDSVLESLVEDAAETGLKAEFVGGCGAVLPLRPLATRRVFSNLIDNALVHGGSVAVRAEQTNTSVSVFVRDHGTGMSPEILERAFDPFFRAEESRSRETGGTGLGLTIARMLAAKIGATLQLRNHPEGGLEAEVKWLTAELPAIPSRD